MVVLALIEEALLLRLRYVGILLELGAEIELEIAILAHLIPFFFGHDEVDVLIHALLQHHLGVARVVLYLVQHSVADLIHALGARVLASTR